MMKRSCIGTSERILNESAVSTTIEYVIISGILVMLMVITIPVVTSVFIAQPANILTYHAYVDIGNGVSTRMVDLYAIIPLYNTATIKTKFDIPDEVAGKDYKVDIISGDGARSYDQKILVSGAGGSSNSEITLSGIGGSYEVSLAGIGATEDRFGIGEGTMTARGLNDIIYEYP
ncbi:MAG: hypothetical protein WCK53_14490 [Methanomicrobiales archaeon]